MDVLEGHRQRVREARRELELLEAELRGMEKLAATISPPMMRRATVAVPKAEQGDRKPSGRQPGTISNKWRDVLAVMLGDDRPVMIWRAHAIAKEIQQREMKASEVQRLFKGYADQGLLSAQSGGWVVTDEAVQRFGLQPRRLSEFLGQPAEHENESISDDDSEAGREDVAPSPQPFGNDPQLQPAS